MGSQPSLSFSAMRSLASSQLPAGELQADDNGDLKVSASHSQLTLLPLAPSLAVPPVLVMAPLIFSTPRPMVSESSSIPPSPQPQSLIESCPFHPQSVSYLSRLSETTPLPLHLRPQRWQASTKEAAHLSSLTFLPSLVPKVTLSYYPGILNILKNY